MTRSFWVVVFPLYLLFYMSSLSVARGQEILDVLILYTQDVENYYSDGDGVVSHANASFASANMAFENSEVAIRLRVRAIEKIDYQENSEDMDLDLDYITESESIGLLRDEVGADLVCLFRNGSSSDAAGVAWILVDVNGKPSRGFSVTSAQSAISSFTFQHEIGHNLGGAHDRENTESGGLYPYSYGYRFRDDNDFQRRTIMAYSPGNEINYFSNPSVLYNQKPTGVASGEEAADNARGFNLIASIIGGYRNHIHRLPVANAGEDVVEEDFDGDGLENVALSGSLSSAEEAIISWEWTWVGGQAFGEVISASFPLGVTEVTLIVTDSKGFTALDTVLVTVVAERLLIRSMVAGGENSFFINADGSVWGFGNKASGRLGFFWLGGGSEVSQLDPFTVFSSDVAFVSSEKDHTLFLKSDGSVWGTGQNWNGLLGNGNSHQVFEPIKIVNSGVVDVSTGRNHSLFLMLDGSVWGAGSNRDGELGIGEARESKTLARIFDSDVASVEAGNGQSFFIKKNGSLWFSGLDADNNKIDTPIELIPSGVTTVSCGWDHSLIVKSDGSLWVIGGNQFGQLGIGTWGGGVSVPTRIVASGVIDVAAGRGYGLFLKEDGSLWQTGLRFIEWDQTGNEPKFVVPEMIVPSNVIDVSAGSDNALFQTSEGNIWAVGKNEYGQLGNGNTDYQPEPIVVLASELVENVAPLANAGPDVIRFDHDQSGYSNVSLNGSESSDDWFIRSYIWTWEGGMKQGIEIDAQFDLGDTEVTLTVTDYEKLVNSDKILVTVADPSRHNKSHIVQADGKPWFKVEAYTESLQYTLMTSEDLIQWYPMYANRKQLDGVLWFELQNDSSRFYRVGVEAPE